MSPKPTGLQLKLVALLLAVGLVPVIVSAILIDRIAEVAQSFASNEVERLTPPLERAQRAYRIAVERSKAVHEQVAKRVAADPELANDSSLAREGLVKVVAKTGDTELWTRRTDRPLAEGERLVQVDEPFAGGTLELYFAVDESLAAEFRDIAVVLDQSRRVQKVRQSLPASYRTAFIVVVGGFAVVLALIGVFLGRRVTSRIEELQKGFKQVSGGDMSARVDAQGRGELAEMSRAFNKMVADLEAERRKSAYLQRIGTWQDVARKLAHEIKNPLTPIQLAVQQVESSYKGEDERFGKLLGDASEIVTEEIDNLKRLVDAFRELGRLPRVDAKPLELTTVIDDVRKDPNIADNLKVDSDEQVEVSADRLLLRRVLTNLVENGIQASGKPVHVSWSRTDDGRVEIVVDDHGPGIADEVAETLFEPYITTKDTGTGLGLAIAKKIAIEHRGSLELVDKETEGARFVLVLPVAS
jgi:nitrogen fixation/metabolism regulation signal transduction histidine kinase